MCVRTASAVCGVFFFFFFAQVKAEGLILSLKPSRDSDQLHHLPSPLQSKSRCSSCTPISLSLTPSAHTLPCTSYPQKLHPSHSLYSFPSRCILFIFVYTRHLSCSPSRSLFGQSSSAFSVTFSRPRPQSDCWFWTEVWERYRRSLLEMNGACISLASPPLQISFLLPSSRADA